MRMNRQSVVANTSKIKISKAIHNVFIHVFFIKPVVANTSKIKISKAIHNFEDFLHYLQIMSGPLFFTLERQYIVLFCADAYSTYAAMQMYSLSDVMRQVLRNDH